MNQEQTNITTGKQIRHLRTQLGMTQEELAGELNVTRQALSNWERDVNEPDLNMLKKICFLFGVNMDDFAKEVITKMETYEKKEKRQFNKYDKAKVRAKQYLDEASKLTSKKIRDIPRTYQYKGEKGVRTVYKSPQNARKAYEQSRQNLVSTAYRDHPTIVESPKGGYLFNLFNKPAFNFLLPLILLLVFFHIFNCAENICHRVNFLNPMCHA